MKAQVFAAALSKIPKPGILDLKKNQREGLQRDH
jgi:hypothetical protein